MNANLFGGVCIQAISLQLQSLKQKDIQFGMLCKTSNAYYPMPTKHSVNGHDMKVV